MNEMETPPVIETEITVSERKPWLFKPGVSANPAGRPKGARNRLGETFVDALHADFNIHGKAAIEKVRNDKPEQYLKVIAMVLPKQLEIKTDVFDGISDDQLAALVAAARSALGIIEGDAIEVGAAEAGEPSGLLPPVSETE